MNHFTKKSIIIGLVAWGVLLLTAMMFFLNLESFVHNTIGKPMQLVILLLILLTALLSILPVLGIVFSVIGYVKEKKIKHLIISGSINCLYIVLVAVIIGKGIKVIFSAMMGV